MTTAHKAKPSSNEANILTQILLPPVLTESENFNPVLIKMKPNQSETTERPKQNPTQTQMHQASRS